MLLRLLKHQIAESWHELRVCIERALPPFARTSERSMSFILSSLLSGRMDCWIIVDEKDKTIYAVGTTMNTIDPATQTKSILIYSLYGIRPVPPSLWKSSYRDFLEYVKKKGFHKICAYTSNDAVLRHAKMLGFDLSQTFIVADVEGG